MHSEALHSPFRHRTPVQLDIAPLSGDRVLLLKEGHISLDVGIEQPCPRRIGGPEFDALPDRLLAELGVLDPGRGLVA
jgi:sulfonate transport system ATP-binding protein